MTEPIPSAEIALVAFSEVPPASLAERDVAAGVHDPSDPPPLIMADELGRLSHHENQ